MEILPYLKPDMVKGAHEVTGDSRPVGELMSEAGDLFKAAYGNPFQISGPMASALSSGAATLDDVQKTVADVTKTEFTGSYPISGSSTGFGFAVYDLQAPAKKVFPVLTPFRNRVPRVPGVGSAVHWKQITAISGSGGSIATGQHFLAELPSNSVAGLTLNLPPEIGWAAGDKSTSYVAQGLSGSNSMISQIAGRGYEDIRALVGLSTLQALMLSEERGMFSGRTSALTAPSSVTATAQTPSTGYTALTGVTTNVYVKVTAVTMMGETAGSSAANAGPSGAQDILVSWTGHTGDEAYNVYASTGTADPGDASRFFAGTTGYRKFELSGALPTSGSTVPTADSGTSNSNAYAGIFATLEGGTTPYIKDLETTVTLAAIQNAFLDRYTNLKADPDELWAAATVRRDISELVANTSGSPAYGYRIAIDEAGMGSARAGFIVSAILNEATGKETTLRVHPWLKPGNLVGLSYTLPFPNSEVPNVWEVKLPQDYLQIDWPVIDMNYRTSVICYGALVGYAPDFNFWLKGIQSTTGTQTVQ